VSILINIHLKNIRYQDFKKNNLFSEKFLCKSVGFSTGSDGKYNTEVLILAIKKSSKSDYKKLSFPFKVLVKTKAPLVNYSNYIVNGKISIPKDRSYRNHLLNKNIYGVIYRPKVSNTLYGCNTIFSTPSHLINSFRLLLYNYIEEHFSVRSAGFIISILLGDRSQLDKSDFNNFRETGLAHILAISGLHFGFLSSIICSFFSIFFSKKISLFISTIVMTLYFTLLVPSASCLRALLALIVNLIFRIIGVKISSLSVLIICGLTMLAINPFYLFDISYQFSYIAVFSIILLGNYRENIKAYDNFDQKFGLQKIWQKFIEKVSGACTTSVAASTGMIPLQLSIFGTLQPLSIINSIIFVPLFEIVFIQIICTIFITMILRGLDICRIPLGLLDTSIGVFLIMVDKMNLFKPLVYDKLNIIFVFFSLILSDFIISLFNYLLHNKKNKIGV